jgi:excisionase family DNA binding protein
MADVRVVVVELTELQRMIADTVRAAASPPVSADEWVDARTSGLGRRTFLRLVREGAFPASKRGKAYIARRADVDRYLERQRIAPLSEPSPPAPPCRLPVAPFDPIAAALAEGRLRIVKKPP